MRQFPLKSLMKELMRELSTAPPATRTPQHPILQCATRQTLTFTPPVTTTGLTPAATSTPQQPVATLQQPVVVVTPQRPAAVASIAPTLPPHKRRRQIQFAYELLDTPPEWTTPEGDEDPINQWEGNGGVIQRIVEYLMWESN